MKNKNKNKNKDKDKNLNPPIKTRMRMRDDARFKSTGISKPRGISFHPTSTTSTWTVW